MIEVKFFELRDSCTCISAMCVSGIAADIEDDAERWLVERSGWNEDRFVYLTNLESAETHYDPYEWRCEPYRTCHEFIREHWDELKSGELIDARVLCGEQTSPVMTDRCAAIGA